MDGFFHMIGTLFIYVDPNVWVECPKMKFYNRTNELAELRRIQKLSFSDHSRCSAI